MLSKMKLKLCIVLFIGLFQLNPGIAQKRLLKKWPSGNSPKEVGAKLTRHFIETPHTNFGSPNPPGSLTYSEVCTWYGALLFSEENKDNGSISLLEKRLVKLATIEKKIIPRPNHVDNNVFGAIPFEMYRQTRKQDYLGLALPFADKQWELPANANKEQQRLHDSGFSWQTRMWIDDMFMITAVQAQAYRATGDKKYIDRAAKEMVLYLDAIQQPNGLFYHAPDIPFFWGRGNGWMAAGMTELLRSLPKDNPDRPRILKGYQTMMKSLKNFQGADGMWRQLVDDSNSWPETSCTGMFTYAMITGVKNGWLNAKEYAPVARKGWLALITYIDANGDVREVCEGTNKKNDRQYYLDRRRITGDMHGQAPVLWCAFALLK
ncbi:MAG: glycosyl hydrolase [Ferruginibacter sp.]|nr:glycosyl hydrolase [Ferruginibacter sp.]